MVATARDFETAELLQMRSHELRVEQAKAAGAQLLDQVNQCHFARVGDTAEHAFAEERGAERDAVEAADQLIVEPALDAVGAATLKQAGVESDDLVVDPGVRALVAGLAAAQQDLGEGGGAAHGE